MTQKLGSISSSTLTHKEESCGLVQHRIACQACGYPFAEALFESVDDYLQFVNEEPEWPVYDEALGG